MQAQPLGTSSQLGQQPYAPQAGPFWLPQQPTAAYGGQLPMPASGGLQQPTAAYGGLQQQQLAVASMGAVNGSMGANTIQSRLQTAVQQNGLQAFYPPQTLRGVMQRVEQIDFVCAPPAGLVHGLQSSLCSAAYMPVSILPSSKATWRPGRSQSDLEKQCRNRAFVSSKSLVRECGLQASATLARGCQGHGWQSNVLSVTEK